MREIKLLTSDTNQVVAEHWAAATVTLICALLKTLPEVLSAHHQFFGTEGAALFSRSS